MRVILYSFIILDYMCTYGGVADRANDKKFSFQTTTKQFIDDTTSLFDINKSNLHENMLGLGVNSGFSNINRISRMVNSSAQDFSGDLNELNATFEEKKREDAFEKKPAAESPHAVLLMSSKKNSNDSICSGSLITADWVLTAAHCLLSNRTIIYAGGYSWKELQGRTFAEGSQIRIAKSILRHPKYNINNSYYDIGLIKVNASFDITDTVKPVGISTEPWNHRGYRRCQITGFGVVQMGEERPDDMTRKTQTLDVEKPCLCSIQLEKEIGAAAVARIVCARPREDYGVCGGDSGGGLLCDGQIRAVAKAVLTLSNVDWTCTEDLILHQNQTCGSENTLSIFQDSFPFLRWINSHVRLFNDSQISGESENRNLASKPLRAASNLFLAHAIATFIFNKMQCKVSTDL